MANRIKNGTEYSKDPRRGRRVKGSLATRTLRDLAGMAKFRRLLKATVKEGA